MERTGPEGTNEREASVASDRERCEATRGVRPGGHARRARAVPEPALRDERSEELSQPARARRLSLRRVKKRMA